MGRPSTRVITSQLPDTLVWVGQRHGEAEFLGALAKVRTVACEIGADRSIEAETMTRERWSFASLADSRLLQLCIAETEEHTDCAVVPYVADDQLTALKPPVLTADPGVVARWLDRAFARSSLRRSGVRTPAHELVRAAELPGIGSKKPVVVQGPGGSAGSETYLCTGPCEAASVFGRGARLLVSDLIEGLSFNCAGVVFGQGDVVAFPPSVQLLDLERPARSTSSDHPTLEPFGRYYGNTYVSIGSPITGAMQVEVRRVGEAMGADGYRGAFGVDLVVPQGGSPVVIEVNPRFQGSTVLQSILDRAHGWPTLLEQHIAAVVGATPLTRPAETYSTAASVVVIRARRPMVVRTTPHPIREPGCALSRSVSLDIGGAGDGMRAVEESALARALWSGGAFNLRLRRLSTRARRLAASWESWTSHGSEIST